MKKKYAAINCNALNLLLRSIIPTNAALPLEGFSFLQMPEKYFLPRGWAAHKGQYIEGLQKAQSVSDKTLLGITQTGMPNLLEWLYINKYTVLPLDGITLNVIQQCGMPFELPLSLLSAKEYYAASNDFHEKFQGLVAQCDNIDFGWEVNWLRGDGHAICVRMEAAHFAHVVASKLRETANHLLIFQRNDSVGVFPMPGPCDMPFMALQEALPEITKVITYDHKFTEYVPRVEIPDEAYAYSEGAVVFASQDLTRFCFELANLEVPPPMQKALIPIAMNYGSRSRTSIPSALKTCPANFLHMDYQFCKDNSQDAALQKFQEVTEQYFSYARCLLPAFTEMVKARFFTLNEGFQRLEQIWMQYRPALCIGENIAFGERSLGILVANKLNIPTIGLPHAIIAVLTPNMMQLPCTVSIYSSELFANYDRKQLKQGTMAVSLKRTAFENTHMALGTNTFLKQSGKKNILVLPAVSMKEQDSFGSGSYPNYTDNWIAELSHVPQQIAEKVALWYKLHPSCHHGEYSYSHLNKVKGQTLLPMGILFESLLQDVDILICPEYFSSPNIIAMRHNIPVITCLGPETPSFACIASCQYAIAEAGKIVSYPEELWPAIHTLLYDEQAKNDLLQKQNEFLEKELHQYSADNLSQCIAPFIQKHLSQQNNTPRHKLHSSD